jgi:hypothetical protein
MNSQIGEEDFQRHLESFVVDNKDLELLEHSANQFNVFEVIGAVRHELRHSDFLSYLLNPNGNHGLGDIFAKKLFQRAISKIERSSIPFTLVDLDIWNLEDSEVLREWQNIDILFVNETNNLVVAIENKIWTGEHSDQLERYWKVLGQHFKGKRIVGLYLTPDGEKPSHPDFYALDYGQVASLIEDLAEQKKALLIPDVQMLLLHYSRMLRRHIVSESEITDLCQRIYKKHKQALDLIFEHRPDQLGGRAEFLKSLIASSPELSDDISSKTYIRFALKSWETPKLKLGQGWTKSGRILLFEFDNREHSLKLKLQLGPGPQEIREKIFQFACENQPHFKPQSKVLGKQWNEIYGKNFLTARHLETFDEEEIQSKIREQWEDFLHVDMPVLSKMILGIKGLFDEVKS